MTDTYELEVDLDATPERVWHALTDGRELEQWFCEHAEVDMAAGRFDFWGRHTPGAPVQEDGRGRVVAAEPGRRLEVAWRDERIAFDLHDATTVRVVHEIDAPRPTTAEHLPSHWWQFALGHLRNHLAGRGVGPRFDWTWPHHGGFTAYAEVAAPIDLVWDGLVTGWLREDNRHRRPAPQPDHDFGFDVGVVVGIKLLDVVEPTRFSLEWIEEQTTVLSYDLREVAGGGSTFVTIVQSGFAADMDLQGQAEGFFSGVQELAWKLESGGLWVSGGRGTVRRIRDGQHDMRLASERV